MNSGFNKRFYCINYFKILLTVTILNIFNIYSGGCCKKCKTCCAKLCKGDNKKFTDEEKEKLKEYLFGTIFHPGFEQNDKKQNFVFHNYIKVEQLVDKNILKKIGKNGSSNIYTFTIDIDNKEIFKTDDYELSDEDYINWSTTDRPNLKISKKKYEEDKKNNKYTYLRNGRVDFKKYDTIIYYIESGNIYVYCKDITKKLFKEGEDKTDFHYGEDNRTIDTTKYDKINYIGSNNLIERDKQLAQFVHTESSLKNIVSLTFYKEKSQN